MNKAVFLDRDGVINELVFNPKTGEYESPHTVEEFKIFPQVNECLSQIQDAGYFLFLISNQPSYAKGKANLDNIKEIHARLDDFFKSNSIVFKEYYYCYHHPEGIVPEYAQKCQCRKPGNYFILEAERVYGLDLNKSYLIGDCDTDIECGIRSGMSTILVDNPHSIKKRHGKVKANYEVHNLTEAKDIILSKEVIAKL